MIGSLLRIRRMVDGREVQEPTLLALGLTATGFLLLLAVLAGCGVRHRQLRPGLGAIRRRRGAVGGAGPGAAPWRRESAAPVTGRQRWLRRLHGAGRKLFVVVLAGWLGLIAWSELSPRRADAGAEGGAGRRARPHLEHPPRAGARPAVGAEQLAGAQAGAGLRRCARPSPTSCSCRRRARASWPSSTRRCRGIAASASAATTGKSGGEHCAIYFQGGRFQQLDGGTFWLEEPTDRPPGPGLNVKRICTWVRLHDQVSGRTLRVYNTHQYLTEGAQLPASSIILRPRPGRRPVRRDLARGRLQRHPGGAEPAGVRRGRAARDRRAGRQERRGDVPALGVRLRCLDGILVGPGWRVQQYAVVNVKPGGVFPSDHFGVLADLTPGR